MKLKIIAVFLIKLSLSQILEINDLSVSDENLFDSFKQKYHKKYQTDQELQYRFEIFQKNLRVLKSEPDFIDSDGMVLLGSSNKPEKAYTLGINQFVDMTEEEFKSSYLIPENLLYKILPSDGIAPIFNLFFQNDDIEKQDKKDKKLLSHLFGGFSKIFGRKLQQTQLLQNVKRSIDWEQLGKVSPVKNQKRCNSCYAFAATGALESMFSIKYDSDFIALSTQEILDCDSINKGCKGGQPSLVFDYVTKNGLALQDDYEYVAKNQTCQLKGRRLQFYYGNQTSNQYKPYNQQVPSYNNGQLYNQNNQYNYNSNYSNNYTQPYQQQQNNYRQPYSYNNWNTQNYTQQYKPQQQIPYNQNINQQANTNQYSNTSWYNNTNNNINNNTNNNKNNNTNNIINQTTPNDNTQTQDITNQNQQDQTYNNDNKIDEEKIRKQMIEELQKKQKEELKLIEQEYKTDRIQDRDIISQTQDQIIDLIENKKILIEEKQQQIEIIKQKKEKKLLLQFVADEILTFDNKFIEDTKKQIDQLQEEINLLQQNLIDRVDKIEQEQNELYEQKKKEMEQKHEQEMIDLEKQIEDKIKEHKLNNKKKVPKFKRFDFLRTYKKIPQNIVSLLQALQDGPVVVAHHVSSQLKFYSKGVFTGDGCENKPVNHASLIIGYDLDDPNPYFRLKNAWGTKWGEKGYYKIQIGDIGYDKKGICSIAGTPFNVQPVLKQLIFNLQMDKYFRRVNLELTESESKDSEFKKILLKTWKEKMQTHSDKIEKIQKPTLKDYSSNHILLMGLPKTDESKADKVQLILKKKVLPTLKLMDSFESMKLETKNGKTTGIAILRFKNQELANAAANSLDRFILTKTLTLRAITFENFNKVFETTQNQKKDQFKTYDELINWWDEEQIRNHFIVFGQEPTQIIKNSFNPLTKDITKKNQLEFKGRRVIQMGYNSSGNYLMVFFDDILEVYTSKTMEYVTAFYHPKIQSAKFSNDERYIITFNGTVNDTKDTENVIVWDFYLGRKIRIFKLEDIDQQSSFDFSHDSKYFSGFQYQDNQKFLYVYELPNMSVVEDPKTKKKSQLSIKNPWKCSWSPTSNLLAVCSHYTASMDPNTKTELLIYQIPQRRVLPWTIFQFKVKDVDFYWAQNGGYLLVNFLSKIKKATQNIVQLGIFDDKARRFFVSTIQNEKNEKQVNFVAAPNGKNFIEVLKTDQNKKKQTLKFYSVENQKPKQIFELQNESKFTFNFCPNSKYLLMSQKNKNIYFAEYQYSQGKVAFKMYKQIEIPAYDLALWSPCGRYVAFQRKARGGLQVTIHNSVGKALFTTSFDKKQIFVWFKVDKKQKTLIKEDIKKNYMTYFDKDQEKIDKQTYERKKKVEENQKKFQEYFNKKTKLWNENYKQMRVQMLGYDEDILNQPEDIYIVDKRELIDELVVSNV